jgi:hypothetical protein
MRKTALAVLVVMLCTAPAFGWHRKHKDPRVVEHPKAIHPKNPHLEHPVKHKMPKHKS